MFDALEFGPLDILDPRGWVDDVEDWRPIEIAPRYEVSSLGRVRSISTRGGGKTLRPWDSDGYDKVSLYDGGARYVRFVHRLVMAAFVGPRPPGDEIDHFDHDRKNNRLSNLQYVSAPTNWGCKRKKWQTYASLRHLVIDVLKDDTQ